MTDTQAMEVALDALEYARGAAAERARLSLRAALDRKTAKDRFLEVLFEALNHTVDHHGVNPFMQCGDLCDDQALVLLSPALMEHLTAEARLADGGMANAVAVLRGLAL
jgi:hypothetical protein